MNIKFKNINRKLLATIMFGTISLATVTGTIKDTGISTYSNVCSFDEEDKYNTDIIDDIKDYDLTTASSDSLGFIDDYCKKIPTTNNNSTGNGLFRYYDAKKDEFNWGMINFSIRMNTKFNTFLMSNKEYSSCTKQELNDFLKAMKEYIPYLCEKYPSINKEEVANTLAKLSIYADNRCILDIGGNLGNYYMGDHNITVYTKDEMANTNHVEIFEHELTHLVEDSYNSNMNNYTVGSIAYNDTKQEQKELFFSSMLEYTASKCVAEYNDRDMDSYIDYGYDVGLLCSIVDTNPGFNGEDTLIELCLSNDVEDFLKLFKIEDRNELAKLYKILYMIEVANNKNAKIAYNNNGDIKFDRTNVDNNLADLYTEVFSYGIQLLSKNLVINVDKDENYNQNIYEKYDNYYQSCQYVLSKANLNKEERDIVTTNLKNNILKMYKDNVNDVKKALSKVR